ncbi:PREDICTED: uncharacterized protein LOC104822732 [Tarenaya hassleriana]|uniref:uncharacterized protein LOC104822732 n=1 Tax=Tarenaya hassleriana TaxID=28532 RepID=UPI00053C50F2|nr:PREDICTED: uncharacterized protein LOC104822732 [Tarenaya hassleriana]
MEYTVDMSCEMKMHRGCKVCDQKVSEVLHCLHGLYSVDFLGDDGTVKLKGRVNPNVMLTVLERYREHGRVKNLRFEGEVIAVGGGGYCNCQTGYYHPYGPPPVSMAGNYYTYPPPHPGRWRVSQHTAPPLPTLPPPPPRPFHSYLNMETQGWYGI